MTQALSPNLRLIGRYTVLRELRRDRHTVVYLAFDPVLNRELVVKAVQMRPTNGNERAAHDRIEQAFVRQAQAAGRLHHPHILTVFDAGMVNNIGFLALEKVDGKLLEELMVEGYRPGYLQAADIVARVADALEFAHSKGVPHGHLAPSRIYLHGADRMPKVMGFGGWIDSGTTGDFELRGTESMLPYFGNELGAEARRKDVRALGALLFLLLTGTRPDIHVLRKQSHGIESPVLRIRPNAPLPLAEIADGALELHGVRPYSTAAQVRNALTTFLWGNKGSEGLPTAATITGMPARMTVVPARQPMLTVGTVARLPVQAANAPTGAGRVVQLGLVGIAIGALAAIGAVWLNARSKPAEAVAAPVRSTPVSVPAPAIPPPSPASDVSTPAPVAVSDAATEATHATSDATSRTVSPARPATRAAGIRPTAMPVQGVVALAVAPWGEVYVNGAARGTTPPLTQLTLPIGRHTIEVRNGRESPYIAQIDVSADRPQQIRHRFQ